MKISSESAILGIGLITLAYEIFLLKSRNEEILFEWKADYKILRNDIDTLRESSTAAAASRNLEDSPFTCADGYCQAQDTNYFIFPKGIIIGQKVKDEACEYGTGILSVDFLGTNCPSGNGAVTFGGSATASAESATVTGGYGNTANNTYASVSGGNYNFASGNTSSVLGGTENEANDIYSAVSGGYYNIAANYSASICGGYANEALGLASTVSGGALNIASGEKSAISGGYFNEAIGWTSSISGGYQGKSNGEVSSILGGKDSTTTLTHEIFPKESTSSGNGTSPFTCANGWCTNSDNYFQFSKGIVIGQKAIDADCTYGDGILSVDANGRNCPSGQASVTFGTNNKATAAASSVSGGTGNIASGLMSSILGGANNEITTTNKIYPEESTSSGDGTSPFTCANGWCTSSDDYFQFPKGIVVGYKKPKCGYGTGILSVDGGRSGPNKERIGSNCPKGSGSVTFGRKNDALGEGSSILGGKENTVMDKGSTILGGMYNVVLERYTADND